MESPDSLTHVFACGSAVVLMVPTQQRRLVESGYQTHWQGLGIVEAKCLEFVGQGKISNSVHLTTPYLRSLVCAYLVVHPVWCSMGFAQVHMAAVDNNCTRFQVLLPGEYNKMGASESDKCCPCRLQGHRMRV